MASEVAGVAWVTKGPRPQKKLICAAAGQPEAARSRVSEEAALCRPGVATRSGSGMSVELTLQRFEKLDRYEREMRERWEKLPAPVSPRSHEARDASGRAVGRSPCRRQRPRAD